MNSNKFLLVKGRAGLGNRIQGVLNGILYARLTGRRLIVDWGDFYYSDDGSNVFHRFFECSLCGSTDEIPYTDSVSPSIWRGHLRESSYDMGRPYGINRNPDKIQEKFSIDLTKLDYQEDVLVMLTFRQQVDLLRSYFEGRLKEFSQLSKKEILSKLLREDLILHPQIRERVNQFKINNFSRKTVGVHIRYSDHRTSLWSIIRRLNSLLKSETNLQIFLATDNIKIKNMFENSYSDVITTSHWYPISGLILHGNKSCPDLVESGIEALVDLYLLAECDYLIIDTSSTFSYVASLLTKVPFSNVFNVRQGGKGPPRLRRLIWRLMLKLGLFSWGLNLLGKFVRIQKFFGK
jgi:hypothetical protein